MAIVTIMTLVRYRAFDDSRGLVCLTAYKPRQLNMPYVCCHTPSVIAHMGRGSPHRFCCAHGLATIERGAAHLWSCVCACRWGWAASPTIGSACAVLCPHQPHVHCCGLPHQPHLHCCDECLRPAGIVWSGVGRLIASCWCGVGLRLAGVGWGCSPHLSCVVLVCGLFVWCGPVACSMLAPIAPRSVIKTQINNQDVRYLLPWWSSLIWIV